MGAEHAFNEPASTCQVKRDVAKTSTSILAHALQMKTNAAYAKFSDVEIPQNCSRHIGIRCRGVARLSYKQHGFLCEADLSECFQSW